LYLGFYDPWPNIRIEMTAQLGVEVTLMELPLRLIEKAGTVTT